MHVLHVVPMGGIGGVQTHVADLAAGQAARGVRVSVAAGGPGPMASALRQRGIDVVEVPMRRRTDKAAVRDLIGFIQARDFDLVHTHSPLGGILGRRAGLSTHRYLVHTLHGLWVLEEIRHAASTVHALKLLIYRWDERRLNLRTHLLIAPAPAVAQAAIRAGHVPRDRLVVIPHGVDLPRGERTADGVTIAYVGRLHREKGVQDLLDAFVLVRGEHRQARLILVGDGPERTRLEGRIAEDGLREVVTITGAEQDAVEAMQRAACVVLPSYGEGLPYALLEAMAWGIPCIATAVGGTPDLIEHERCGLLIAPGDRRALAGAMLSLLRDPDRARTLGTAARARVAALYARDAMIERTVEAYRRVLNGPQP